MDYDLDEFLEDYDDFARQVRLAKLNIFRARLAQWFELIDNGEESIIKHIAWLTHQINWSQQRAVIFTEDGTVALPSKKLARLAAYLQVMREIHTGDLEFLPFLNHYFPAGVNIQAAADRFIDQFFSPFATELRRYIERYFDEDLPEEEAFLSTPLISASDRLVSINHNSTAYEKLITGLEGLEEQLRGANEILPQNRASALSEVSAIQSLLKSQFIRWDILTSLVVPSLLIVGKLLFDTIGAELINQTIMPSLKVLFPGLLS